MKSINKKSLIALLAAALLLVSSVSIAVAYFSDVDEASGAATLSFSKETKIDEGTSDTEKQIDITNTGTSAIVVRVAVFGPDKLVVTANDNWIKPSDDSIWYYYRYVLQPGDKTGDPELIAKLGDLTDQEMAELGKSLQVTVVQEAEFATYTSSVVDGQVVNTVDAPAGWEVANGFFSDKQ